MNHHLTPLLTGVMTYTSESITRFDVPGHKGGKALDELQSLWGEDVLRMDVNSTKPVDHLAHPTGIILEAEKLLADAFEADNAFMLVNGSTCGVQYMLMSTLSDGDKVLLPRNVHKSAINALILTGAKPVFIEPEIDTHYGIANGITVSSVKHAFDLNDDIKAILVIHPTYFGAISELEAIIQLAHEKGVPVLVDQAHGAHFPFHPELPDNACKLGADLVTVSMHKTGGSLTQSSVLLHNDGLIDKLKVRSTINLMQTTSASYLLMCSLDYARHKLATEGHILFHELINLTKHTKTQINQIPGFQCMDVAHHFDPLRLLIRVSDLGVSGFYIYDLLASDYNIQLELAEPHVVLAIISLADTKESLSTLVSALKDISKKLYTSSLPSSLNTTPVVSLHNKLLLTPREAYYHPKKLISIDEADGLISGESIMIYPPGIPLIIPGEMITKPLIEYYHYLQKQDTVILNATDNLNHILVLDSSQEENMIDLWYTENHQEDTKFSIKVKSHLHSEKSAFQQIDFFESDTFGKFFTLDGLMMVTEKDEFIYHDMITHVPMAVNPEIKKVLIIGGGDGGTAREILRYKSIEKVDMVEIDERVVRLCQKYIPQTACKLDADPRLCLHFEDGLKFVHDAKDASYDLILVDSTDPIGPGEGLFTYDFYNNCKRVLSEVGILINQHESPYYDSYAHEMKRAHSKIKDTFPIAQVYQFHMPTYPSGHWLFGFASKKFHPLEDLKADAWNAFGLHTRYYNTDLHKGAFMLPTYIKESLENA